MGNVLIVFTKYPEQGKVKTRLAKSIGADNASKLYASFVPIILNRTKSDVYSTKVFFDPLEKQDQVKKWLGLQWDYLAQSSGDLGQRLKNAFSSVFAQGARKIIIIGSDTPLLDSRLIKEAFLALDKADCVIGPSSDGGYYLLGLKILEPELFDLEEWSTNLVFEKTMQKALKLNLKPKILEEHFDIDEKEDLIMLAKKLERLEFSNDHDLNKLLEQISNIIKIV